MQGMDSEIAAVRADLKELSKDIKIQMESVQDVKEVRMPEDLSRCMCVPHTHRTAAVADCICDPAYAHSCSHVLV